MACLVYQPSRACYVTFFVQTARKVYMGYCTIKVNNRAILQYHFARKFAQKLARRNDPYLKRRRWEKDQALEGKLCEGTANQPGFSSAISFAARVRADSSLKMAKHVAPEPDICA